MSTSYASDIRQLREGVNELLARHDQTRDVANFVTYKGRPVDFFREVLNFEPYDKQVEMAEAFHRHRRVTVRGAHGTGKDAGLAPLMLYAAYVCGMLVLAISATEKQLLGQLWREIGKRFSVRLPGELYTADLRIGGEKRIIAMTSGSVSNLTGWHDPHGVFVAITEAQGEQVESAAFDAAIANAVDDASRIFVVGNPVRSAGRFYEVSNKPTWHAIQISALDHPNVREGHVVIPGGPAPGWPAEMAAEFGTNSPWYISRVLGEFPPDGTVDSLIRRSWLEAAYALHESERGLIRETPRPLVALDVARSFDRDQSVAAVIQGNRVHSLTAWHSRDLVDTASRFLNVAEKAREDWLVAATGFPATHLAESPSPVNAGALSLHVDAPSIGAGVIDELKRRKKNVTEYWGWSPARDVKRFANARAENYWHLRSLLESGKCALPRDPLLHEEAMAYEWSQDAKGRIIMLSKEELRKTLGRSPDRLDACVIGLAASSGKGAWTPFRFVWY